MRGGETWCRCFAFGLMDEVRVAATFYHSFNKSQPPQLEVVMSKSSQRSQPQCQSSESNVVISTNHWRADHRKQLRFLVVGIVRLCIVHLVFICEELIQREKQSRAVLEYVVGHFLFHLLSLHGWPMRSSLLCTICISLP